MLVYWKCESFVMQMLYVCVHPVAVYCVKSFTHIECYSDCSRMGSHLAKPLYSLLWCYLVSSSLSSVTGLGTNSSGYGGRTIRIDLKPHLCSDKKSLSASFCVGFVILEGVLAVLALSIFPVDLILLSSFLSIDLAKENSMSLHSLYSTPFTEVGKNQ